MIIRLFGFSALEHLEKLCALVCDNISCLKVDPTFTEEEEQLKKEKDKETTTTAPSAQVKEKGENQENG